MTRRRLIATAALATLGVPARAGDFSGKIRKSLKWSMVKQAAGMPLEDAFHRLLKCGFQGVEVSIETVKDAAQWTAASQSTGLIIDGTVGGRLPHLKRGLELTKALGGESILVVVEYDVQRSLTAQWQEAVAQLRDHAAEAQNLGIKILIENVWNTFLISAFDMARFVDEVGSPSVQVHFDIGNMVRWGVPEHWAEVLGRRIQKLDVKEYDLDIAMKQGLRKGFDVPLGEGSINWPGVRNELKKIAYQGWAAAEVKAGDWDYLADVSRRMDVVLDL